MSRLLGVEIGDDRLRAVLRRRRAPHLTFEVPFTRGAIEDGVHAMQALAGDVASIHLAFGLAHVHVKQVSLPPVPHAARRQMLLVEPERWFAMAGETPAAIALDADGSLALAADGAFVDACVAAFARWAPVQRVEAAPMAVTRAFRASGADEALAVLDAAPGEIGIVHVEGGALRAVRRIRVRDEAPSLHAATELAGVDPIFATAFGASLPADATGDSMLLTTALERRFASEQRRRLVAWSAMAAAAACVAVWSLGVSRGRTLDVLDAAVAEARTTAQPAHVAMTRARRIDQELAAIAGTVATRPDALMVLAAIGVRLPVEAVAQRVRMVGADWQIEGNATTASAVLAALAAEPQFERVRFLAPSNRFRDGTEDRETFAIAFGVR